MEISLAPLKLENLELYRQNRNEPAIRRWCRQVGLIDELSQKAWFERQSADPAIHMLEIVNAGGEPLGVCGLTDINYHCSRAEFSLYIFKKYHGQGLGKKALKKLIWYGFLELGLNLIWGETVGDNPAGNMFMSLGFKKTGYRPDYYFKDGKRLDSFLYCLKRTDWLAEVGPG